MGLGESPRKLQEWHHRRPDRGQGDLPGREPPPRGFPANPHSRACINNPSTSRFTTPKGPRINRARRYPLGTTTVVLTITDTHGESSTCSGTVTASVLPNPRIYPHDSNAARHLYKLPDLLWAECSCCTNRRA